MSSNFLTTANNVQIYSDNGNLPLYPAKNLLNYKDQ